VIFCGIRSAVEKIRNVAFAGATVRGKVGGRYQGARHDARRVRSGAVEEAILLPVLAGWVGTIFRGLRSTDLAVAECFGVAECERCGWKRPEPS